MRPDTVGRGRLQMLISGKAGASAPAAWPSVLGYLCRGGPLLRDQPGLLRLQGRALGRSARRPVEMVDGWVGEMPLLKTISHGRGGYFPRLGRPALFNQTMVPGAPHPTKKVNVRYKC